MSSFIIVFGSSESPQSQRDDERTKVDCICARGAKELRRRIRFGSSRDLVSESVRVVVRPQASASGWIINWTSEPTLAAFSVLNSAEPTRDTSRASERAGRQTNKQTASNSKRGSFE